MRSLSLVVLVACAGAHVAPDPKLPPDQARAAVAADQERYYTIWLGGAQVGVATETERWTRVGVHLVRNERMRFLRGDTPVELVTTIEITADRALAPSHVTWTERGQTIHHASAIRDPGGWTVTTADAVSHLPATAIPGELVPLLIRRDGRFAGAVFLPARGFVVASGRIDPVAPDRLVARLAFAGGAIAEATIDLDADHLPARIVDGEGVIAMRANVAQATASYPLVDLIAATSVPVTGTQTHRILIDGDIALPPLPGQAAHIAVGGVELELSAKLPGDLPPGPSGRDRSREITALVAYVQSRIAPDLGASAMSARDAAAATAGDCTTFALAYAALAQRRAITTRIVTGLRVDGDRLVRHRWAVSWTGRAWIAVDAAFGAAPAGGDLIGLAVHDADAAGLVAGEAALMQVRSAAYR